MRPIFLYAAAALGSATIASAPAGAQIGRFPIFSGLGTRTGRCRFSETTPALREQGVQRVVLLVLEGEPSRGVGVGIDTRGDVTMVNTSYSVQAGAHRREGETMMASYSRDGVLKTGARNYGTTGSPALMSEDRRGPLTATDAAAARTLARAVLARCGRG